MEGSAIRRIGYARWLRNIAVGLGNANYDVAIITTLAARRDDPSPLVREHVAWALVQQEQKRDRAGIRTSSVSIDSSTR
jgi:epoxyqueuosine reductase